MTTRYLTQILLRPDDADRAGLRDTYDWHQKIWLAFPGRDGLVRDFLTRLDVLDGQMRLLALSLTRPERPPWCPRRAWQSKKIPPMFLNASTYRFSLVANPTRKTRVPGADGKWVGTGRREFINHRDDRAGDDGRVHPGLLSWLARKAADHGFSIPDLAQVRTLVRPRQYFIKGDKRGMHGGVEFQGVLDVVDLTAFEQAFVRGIGSAKAFGFGMLVLARVK